MDYSIVTTVFNDELKIRGFLENICTQDYQPKEIIIVDGGSSDNTPALIQEYLEKTGYSIKLIYGKRLNIAQGLNTAISIATSELIGIAAVGNHYDKDFFRQLAAQITEETDISYSVIKGIETTLFSKIYNQVFLNGIQGIVMSIASNHGAMIKKQAVEEAGYFYEGFYYAGEDEEFYNRIRHQNKKSIICRKASVYWETPKTLKEYKKQEKVYTIAKMQIYSNMQLFYVYRKKIVYLMMFIAGIFLLFLPLPLFGKSLLLGALCIYNLYITILKGALYCGLKNLSYLLPLYYMLQNTKYLRQRNKMDIKREEKDG